MKRTLAIFPIIASFLFGYSCASKPEPTPTENYTFTFEGTKCKIDNFYNYSKTLTKSDKKIVFEIDVNQPYMLPIDGVKIDGDNAIYDEETHKITISEVTGNIKVTAIAREPVFTFKGSNCSINDNPSFTQKLRMGERVSFKIDITQQDYVLLKANVFVTGKNWTYDEANGIFTIDEVAGDVKVTATATATQCTFTFNGTNCTIKDKSDFTKILDIGEKNVEFEVIVPITHVLTSGKVKINGKNVDYNEKTHKITISEVVGDISITADANVPIFSFKGTYCTVNGSSTYTQSLVVGAHITYDVVLLDSTTLPKTSVKITGYNTSYDETTHKITVSDVASDIVVEAVAIPEYVNFASDLTNCHFEKKPETRYPAYSKVNLRIVEDNRDYNLPQNIIVEPATLDYTYNPDTGLLIINSMPPVNLVKISAESALGWIRIDDKYQIVLGGNQQDGCQDAHQINDALDYSGQNALTIVDEDAPSKDTEIVLDSERSEAIELRKTITEDEGYAIKVIDKKIVVAAKTKLARTCAVDRLLTDYYSKYRGLVVPTNYDVKGTCKKSNIVIEIELPNNNSIRDPFIVYENGSFYLYGTHNEDGVNTEWRVYKSLYDLRSGWELYSRDITDGKPIEDISKDSPDRWAPEIHKYTDPVTNATNYYMFTTYRSKKTELTGVVVFKSDSLAKNFKLYSRHEGNEYQPGFIFDEKLSGLDGTLYVDSNKTPWMFYGGQYNKYYTDDRTYVLCRLKNNLEQIEGDYVNIFNAELEKDKYWWSEGKIGDGPFINKLSDGRLLMQFSNFDKDGDYAVGFLINKGGDEDIKKPSKWIPQKRTIYRKDIYNGAVSGGHSMTFNVEKQMYMCIHTPNITGKAKPLIFPVKEAYGTLVWDLYSNSK